jgi:hypothetical protein
VVGSTIINSTIHFDLVRLISDFFNKLNKTLFDFKVKVKLC